MYFCGAGTRAQGLLHTVSPPSLNYIPPAKTFNVCVPKGAHVCTCLGSQRTTSAVIFRYLAGTHGEGMESSTDLLGLQEQFHCGL